jgi:hypothetical protein
MTLPAEDGFLALSATLTVLQGLLALDGLGAIVRLFRARSDPEIAPIKENLDGNLWSQVTFLLAESGLLIMALEPYALPGPVGGTTRALSLRLVLLFLANESILRWNYNAKFQAAGFGVRATGVFALMIYVTSTVILVVSLMESDCNLRCKDWLQAAVCIAAGLSLLATNSIVVMRVFKRDPRMWVKALSLLQYLSAPTAAAISAWEALDHNPGGRITVMLQSPVGDDYELYYAIQVLAFLVYILCSQILLYVSRGGTMVNEKLARKGYNTVSGSRYVDRPEDVILAASDLMRVAPEWFF